MIYGMDVHAVFLGGKMKKLMTVVLCAGLVVMTGCNKYRAEMCILNVFPNAQILDDELTGYTLGKYTFLVKTESQQVYLVKCYGANSPQDYREMTNLSYCREISSLFQDNNRKSKAQVEK